MSDYRPIGLPVKRRTKPFTSELDRGVPANDIHCPLCGRRVVTTDAPCECGFRFPRGYGEMATRREDGVRKLRGDLAFAENAATVARANLRDAEERVSAVRAELAKAEYILGFHQSLARREYTVSGDAAARHRSTLESIRRDHIEAGLTTECIDELIERHDAREAASATSNQDRSQEGARAPAAPSKAQEPGQ